MPRDRKCHQCGEIDEFLYELDWKPVYYCATCDRQTDVDGAEIVGPDD